LTRPCPITIILSAAVLGAFVVAVTTPGASCGVMSSLLAIVSAGAGHEGSDGVRSRSKPRSDSQIPNMVRVDLTSDCFVVPPGQSLHLFPRSPFSQEPLHECLVEIPLGGWLLEPLV